MSYITTTNRPNDIYNCFVHFAGASPSVLIEEAVVTRQRLLPSTQWYNVTHIGAVANISFSYRMVCLQNYYGNSCSRLCVPRDDANGHYSCDINGNRVCLPGWSNVAAYCTTGSVSVFYYMLYEALNCHILSHSPTHIHKSNCHKKIEIIE